MHWSEKTEISKFEKYFDFSKMDKKNVQNRKTKILYGKTIRSLR